jgi:hypothetical protein
LNLAKDILSDGICFSKKRTLYAFSHRKNKGAPFNRKEAVSKYTRCWMTIAALSESKQMVTNYDPVAANQPQQQLSLQHAQVFFSQHSSLLHLHLHDLVLITLPPQTQFYSQGLSIDSQHSYD